MSMFNAVKVKVNVLSALAMVTKPKKVRYSVLTTNAMQTDNLQEATPEVVQTSVGIDKASG